MIIRSYLELVEGSPEIQRSRILCFVKVFLCTVVPKKISVLTHSDRGYIVCLKKSYSQKPQVYDQIAESLDCGVITTGLGFNLKNNLSLRSVLRNSTNQIYMWSDVQVFSRILLLKIFKNQEKYSVYQHGAISFMETQANELSSLEWRNTRAKTFYAWTFGDKDKISNVRDDLDIKVIGEPKEPKRKVVDGIGFATRGVEFFKEDLKFFRESVACNDDVAIYFHPTYSRLRRWLFVIQCTRLCVSAHVGNDEEVSSRIVTLSRSFERIASDCGCEVL